MTELFRDSVKATERSLNLYSLMLRARLLPLLHLAATGRPQPPLPEVCQRATNMPRASLSLC